MESNVERLIALSREADLATDGQLRLMITATLALPSRAVVDEEHLCRCLGIMYDELEARLDD